MPNVGITGNIGSGKSTVCRIFNTLQIPVFYADVEARMLYYREDIKQNVRKLFGNKVFDNNDEVDTKILATIIFSDTKALKAINHIIHPAVMRKYQEWLETHTQAPYTLHEAAVLFENNLKNLFYKVINVYAPAEIRLRRVMERDGSSINAVKKRMYHQWSDKKKNDLADFVITNEGKSFLIPQIIKIHHQLMEYKK